MKITLLKDVSISPTEVGTAGQTVELPEQKARDFIRAGLATEPVAPAEPKAKQDKPAETRTTKPAKGPSETK